MIYVIDMWMLSIYADTKWHLEMLCGNMVKIITPNGDATIVICTKVEVVRLGSNNIWLEKGPRLSIARMCHHLCGSTFSVRLRTKKATFERNKERLRKEAVAAEGNYPNAEDDEEAQLQCAIHLSRAEELYHQGVE
jgi:hypothetical protein